MLNLNKLINLNNHFSTISYNNLNTRAKVDTGKYCNYKCSFCYYLNNLNDDAKSKELIKSEMLNYKKRGITEVDFSGGESTKHPDFLELISFGNEYFDNVSMLSNGSFTYEMLIDYQKNGLSEILFSLHGWDSNSHNKRVGMKDSNAFDNMINRINDCNSLGIRVRLNCTVDNNFNPQKYYDVLKNLQFEQLNFLPMNYWDDASNKKHINYNIVSKSIIQFINLETRAYDINIRYVPFCFFTDLPNYRNICKSTFDHIMDKRDWNIQVYENSDISNISVHEMLECANKNRIDSYIKPLSCRGCVYEVTCDGIEPNLLDSHKLINIKE